jgi:hypothetical protein
MVESLEANYLQPAYGLIICFRPVVRPYRFLGKLPAADSDSRSDHVLLQTYE